METRNKKKLCFAQARYLLTKLCNIFDEAFLFDVSIYKTRSLNDIILVYYHKIDVQLYHLSV